MQGVGQLADKSGVETAYARRLMSTLGAAGLWFAFAASAGGGDGTGVRSDNGRTREIRRFDFEEVDRNPVSFPIDFYRLEDGGFASDPAAARVRGGFPPFGTMGFAADQARSGRWSFKFTLEGGSMGAATTPRCAPIIPGGDYLVTAWVRTEGLRHARARVTATVFDQHRRPIPGSHVTGELLDTRGAWAPVALRVPAREAEAAMLGVELLLLQPDQWSGRTRDRDEPMLEDLSGSVWFDDVAIWHVPRFDVRTTSEPGRGNLIVPPEEPGLLIHVGDLSAEPLTVNVTVVDLFDRIVHQESFEVASGRTDRRIALPGLRYGWYRATIDLNASRDWLGRDVVNFGYLPPGAVIGAAGSQRSTTLGLALDDEPTIDAAAAAARIAAELGCTPVILPAWDAAHNARRPREAFEPLRTAAERISQGGGEVVFALPLVPDDLASTLALRRDDVLALFTTNSESTRPSMERMLFVLGQRVARWQIGATGGQAALWRDDLGVIHDQMHATLARLVPGPIVVYPWSIEYPINSGDPVSAMSMHVPWKIPPAAIGDLLQSWPAGTDITLVIEPLPEGDFTNDDRITDLTLRVLHARRAGAERLVIARPWTRLAETDEPMPEPWLPAWLEVGRRLHGLSFAGEVPLGRGLNCWLFDGPSGPVLAVWNNNATGPDATLAEQLAAGPVTVIDPLGNRRTVPLERGVHRVALEAGRPVFIGGVDSGLARFRQRFALTPDSAPSMQREHRHELVLANPWGTTISGVVRIVEPQHWRFTPTRIPFTIAAGAEARLPFSLSFGPNELAGPKRIEAEIELTSGQRSAFRVSTSFELGAAGLVLEPLWRVMGEPGTSPTDLLITAHVTNTGDQPVSLESFVRAPGYPRMSRSIARLGPGETTIRTFHLAGGATTLAGQSVIVGLTEVDGPLRLNREITLPSRMVNDDSGQGALTRETGVDPRH